MFSVATDQLHYSIPYPFFLPIVLQIHSESVCIRDEFDSLLDIDPYLDCEFRCLQMKR